MDTNDTQTEILERLIFGASYKRIMAMSEESSSAMLDKVYADEKEGFENLTRFELQFLMWNCLSLMVGYNYQPAETQSEYEMELETARQFWGALRAYIDQKKLVVESLLPGWSEKGEGRNERPLRERYEQCLKAIAAQARQIEDLEQQIEDLKSGSGSEAVQS